MNADEGQLHIADGYHCDKCKNKGMIYYADGIYTKGERCECWTARTSIRRMKASGLEDVISKYTFAKYKAEEEWQKKVKAAAKSFLVDEQAKWFFMGGASGSGKSHICTAICRELLKNKAVHYMMWEEEANELKACKMDAETYQPRMNRLKEVDVLYIDDFFSRHRDGELVKPTDPDIKLAREIMNHRYVNGKITIISSEWYSMEIFDLDDALGGRIIEMCGKYCLNVGRGTEKNYRLKLGGSLI